MLDFHNHLMPAVDDGAVDIDESRTGLEMLQSQGIREIITTPHLRGSLTDRPRELNGFLTALDEAWELLSSLAESEFPELRLERGVELMLDIPRPNLEDPRLRLAGTSYALVEVPFARAHAFTPCSMTEPRLSQDEAFSCPVESASPTRWADGLTIADG